MRLHHSGIAAIPKGADWKFAFFGQTAIYAIGPKDGRPLKIGMASDIYARFTNMQCCHWQQLWVHYLAWSQGPLVAQRVEKEAHKILGANRVRGEWFDIPPQLACETIHLAADRIGVKLSSHKTMVQRLERATDQDPFLGDIISPLFWSRKVPGGS